MQACIMTALFRRLPQRNSNKNQSETGVKTAKLDD